MLTDTQMIHQTSPSTGLLIEKWPPFCACDKGIPLFLSVSEQEAYTFPKLCDQEDTEPAPQTL